MASSSSVKRKTYYCEVEDFIPRRNKVLVDKETVIRGGVKKKRTNVVVDGVRKDRANNTDATLSSPTNDTVRRAGEGA